MQSPVQTGPAQTARPSYDPLTQLTSASQPFSEAVARKGAAVTMAFDGLVSSRVIVLHRAVGQYVVKLLLRQDYESAVTAIRCSH